MPKLTQPPTPREKAGRALIAEEGLFIGYEVCQFLYPDKMISPKPKYSVLFSYKTMGRQASKRRARSHRTPSLLPRSTGPKRHAYDVEYIGGLDVRLPAWGLEH